jgi:hypothetical protein
MALRLGLRSAAIAGALAIGLLLTGSGADASAVPPDEREADEAAGEGLERIVSGRVSPPDHSEHDSSDHSSDRLEPSHDGGSVIFTDVSADAGIAATHTAQRTNDDEEHIGYSYLITGQAWGDYDQDGRVDLYVTDQLGSNTLYHNEGDGTFSVSPLSESLSLPEDMSGGAVFADYDNDGWPDLYVLSYEDDVLFHNEKGRGFTNVTSEAGIGDSGRGMTASWGDYDKDGYLDLYVANSGCHPCDSPDPSQGDPDLLYHNNGDGTFTDVSAALPAEKIAGWGFVTGWLDYDNDGDLDIYLVNDVRGTRYLQQNVLLRNDGPGCDQWCFTDVSEASGTGVRMDGMGLAVGDYDNDQDLDLYVTNTGWAHLPLTGPAVLLRNEGNGTFTDVSRQSSADVDALTWGAVFLDYDNDGWQDLYVALGGDPEQLGPRVRMNRLLHNRGDGTFKDTSDASGASYIDDTFGVAAADYNNDGWTDLLTGNVDDGYKLYANAGAAGVDNHRLTVRLRGDGPVNWDAVGARVYLTTTDGRTQMREVMAGSSLGAGNDLALDFGLGEAEVSSLRVKWPDGLGQTFYEVPSDTLWQLSYGGEPSVSELAEPSVLGSELRASQQSPPGGNVRPGGYVVPELGLLSILGFLGWLLARRLGRLRLAFRLLIVLVVGTLSFQAVHFIEHLSQLGYWFVYPAATPWMTPWGRVAADGLAALAGDYGGHATGMELLHLVGNSIFFIGIATMYLALRARGTDRREMRATRFVFWLQLVHVLEHVSLTSTYLFFGTPIGMSTLFGYSFHLEGAWASSIRIWWHFTMVLVTTGAAVLALGELRRAGLFTTSAPPTSTTSTHETPDHEHATDIPDGQKEKVGS